MERFKHISYTYSNRTKRYTIYTVGVKKLLSKLSKRYGKSLISSITAKVKDASFEIYEFFLLELEYMLKQFKSDEDAINDLIPVLPLVNDLIEFIDTKTWVRERYEPITEKLDLSYVKTVMRYEPLPHQLKVFEKYERVKHMANLRGFLMDVAAGGGKTYTSLALGEALHYNTIVIIAPRQVLHRVWEESLRGDKERLYKQKQSVCMLGTKDKEYHGERFIVFHYEYLDKIVKNDKLLKQLKRKKPYLIVDEFHNFNEIKSKRTNNLLDFVNRIDFKDISLLTGTPIKMSTKELVPMLYILDKKFPPVVDTFIKIYSSVNIYNQELLQYRFGLYRERVEKDQKGLPKLHIDEYRVKIPDPTPYLLSTIKEEVELYKVKRLNEILNNFTKYEDKFLYLVNLAKTRYLSETDKPREVVDKMYNDFINDCVKLRQIVDEGKLRKHLSLLYKVKGFEEDYILPYLTNDEKKEYKEVAPIFKYPKFKVMGEALGKIILGKRIQCYNELAKYTPYERFIEMTDKKTLIFSNYVSVCDTAVRTLKKKKYNPIGVYGDSTNDLTKIVKRFFEDPNANPLVATYKSLSTGVPLIVANVMLALDLPFRMYIFDQAVARLHRIGQDKPVYVFLIRLDSGDEFNITDRDLFILNMSQMNVELITNVKFPYTVPTITKEEPDSEEDVDIVKEEVSEIALDYASKYDFGILSTLKDFLFRTLMTGIKIKI